jgi:hypothetical protein
MTDKYRVEKIVPAPLVSHADFFALPAYYTLTRIRDNFLMTVKLDRKRVWEVGNIVVIDDKEFFGNPIRSGGG